MTAAVYVTTAVYVTAAVYVNTNKTKFMVAKSNRLLVSKLTYNNMIIEQVTSFKYLGIEFSYDGDNLITKSDLYKRGLKAYFELMRSLNPHHLYHYICLIIC